MADIHTDQSRFEVAGDYDAARSAARLLLLAAAALERRRAGHHEAARLALSGWSGRYAVEFESRFADLQRESAELQALLEEAAGTLGKAADTAETERQRRGALRAAAGGAGMFIAG